MRRQLLFRSAVFVLAGVVSLGLVACGGDDDDDTTTTAVDETTTTEVTTDDDVDDEPDPDTGVDSPEAEARVTVGAFMGARVADMNADAWLTDEAREIYPDVIALYDVEGYDIGEVLAADANSFEVSVEVTTTDGGSRTETMFVGPGEVAGEQVPFAIRGAVVT